MYVCMYVCMLIGRLKGTSNTKRSITRAAHLVRCLRALIGELARNDLILDSPDMHEDGLGKYVQDSMLDHSEASGQCFMFRTLCTSKICYCHACHLERHVETFLGASVLRHCTYMNNHPQRISVAKPSHPMDF